MEREKFNERLKELFDSQRTDDLMITRRKKQVALLCGQLELEEELVRHNTIGAIQQVFELSQEGPRSEETKKFWEDSNRKHGLITDKIIAITDQLDDLGPDINFETEPEWVLPDPD